MGVALTYKKSRTQKTDDEKDVVVFQFFVGNVVGNGGSESQLIIIQKEIAFQKNLKCYHCCL